MKPNFKSSGNGATTSSFFLSVFTMQHTAGPVKRVQLQLSGSNLQPTTQSHSKTPRHNKPGMRQSPQGPRRLNGKFSDLRGRQFTPRHQETWSWWQVQFTPRDLKRHLIGNFRWRHSHSQVITMSSAEDKLLNKFKVNVFFLFLNIVNVLQACVVSS